LLKLRRLNYKMPLFVCEKCGYIDNTATSACCWPHNYEDEGKPILCSKCCPEHKGKVSTPRKMNKKPTKEQLAKAYYWGRVKIVR
jgi:hypothetical protein